MPRITIGEVSLDVAVHGPSGGPPLLAISGLGQQRIAWPAELLDGLAARGIRTITFDNRDAGHSTWLDAAGLPAGLAEAVLDRRPVDEPPAYTLSDMADDGVGVLDALGLDRAHVVGVSMGGMIAQRLAMRHPDRVVTLTSVMSTTGARDVGQSTTEALARLVTPAPSDRAAHLEHAVGSGRIWGGPLFDEQRARTRAAAAFDRAYHPAGVARQLHAIQNDGDRTPGLRRITVPTLVVHGGADTLITPSGGRATAAAIPGARLWLHPQMGHDLSPVLLDELTALLAEHVLSPAEGVAGR